MSLDVTLNLNGECVFEANITHNLTGMADAAGIYECVWRPEEHGLITASDITPKLRAGVAAMASDPVKFKEHDSPNGWGLYENFMPWLIRYLEACLLYPEATISVSR